MVDANWPDKERLSKGWRLRHMEGNPNTVAYWDSRFGGGGWAAAGGFSQTRLFAESQVGRFRLDSQFSGSLCDFGCGAGDAFPAYRERFPKARLVGVDFSSEAIQLARKRFGSFAEFHKGSINDVPASDVIVASNVMEHLTDDLAVARALRSRCRVLYITVPYAEGSPLSEEHLRSYGLDAFGELDVQEVQVFPVRGWSEFGSSLLFHVHIKNIARALLGKPLRSRSMQVMFSIGRWSQ